MSDYLAVALERNAAQIERARAIRASKAPNRKIQYPHVTRLFARMAERRDSIRTLASALKIANEHMHQIMEGERIPRGDLTLNRIAAYLREDFKDLKAEINAIPAQRRLAKAALDWSEVRR